MLRTLFISLWACVVTAGTLYYGLTEFEESLPVETKEPPVKKESTYSEPMIVFGPVVSMSEVTGYLFSNISIVANTEILEKTTIPLDLLIQDGYLTYLAGNKDFALPDILKFDDAKLKMGVKNQINETLGIDLVETIYMSDINFLKVQDARGDSGLNTIQLHAEAHKKAELAEPKTEPDPHK